MYLHTHSNGYTSDRSLRACESKFSSGSLTVRQWKTRRKARKVNGKFAKWRRALATMAIANSAQ